MAYEPTLDDVLNSLYGPEGGLTEEELAQYMPEPYAAPEYTPSEIPQSGYAPQGVPSTPIKTGKGGKGTENLKSAYQYFVSQGFAPHQAAAIVGNLAQESAGRTTAVGGNVLPNDPHSVGLGQWNRERLYGGKGYVGLIPFAKQRGSSPEDLQTQLDYVMQELHGPERAAYNRLMQAGSLEEATRAFGKAYERPREKYANYGNRIAQARKYLGAEVQPIAAQEQAQPQESPFDIVRLSDGTSVDVAKGSSLADLAAALKASGIDAEPLKQVALPDGSYVDAPFSYADEQVLEGMKQHAPDAFGEQPEDTKHGYGAAAKSSFEAGIGSAFTGLGGLGTELGKRIDSPLARQAGEYLTGKGKEWQKMGEEAYQELTPEEAKAMGFEGQFRKYVGEPVAGFVGSMGAALPALALPGGAATRVGAFATQELGGQLAEQERMGQAPDVEKALPYAVGSGIVQNSLLGPLKYVTKAFGKPDVLAKIAEITKTQGVDAAKQYAGGVMKNILKETGVNTGEVVVSEVISRAAERAASGQPLDTPDAISEYEDIAIKSAPGGLLGIPGAYGVHAAKQGVIEETQLAQAQEAQNLRIAEEQKAAEEQAAVANEEQAAADAELERQAGIGVEAAPIPEPTIRGKENVAPTEPPLVAEEQLPPVEPVSAPPPVTPEIAPEAIQAAPEVAEAPSLPTLPTHFSDTLGIASKSGKKTDIPLRKALAQLDIENPQHQPVIAQALEEGIKLAEKGQIQLDVPKAQEIINFIKPIESTESRVIMPSKTEEQKSYVATRQPDIIQEGAQKQPRGTAEDFGIATEKNVRGMESLTQRVQNAARIYTEKGRNAAAKLLRESLPRKAGQQNILEYFDRNRETLRASGDYGTVAREAITTIGTRTPQGRKWVEQLSRELGAVEQQRTSKGARENLSEQVGEALQPMQGVPKLREKAPVEGPVYSMLPEAESQQTEARSIPGAKSSIQPSPKIEVFPYDRREQKGTQQESETEASYRTTERTEAPEVQGTIRGYVPGTEGEAPRKSIQPETGVEPYAKPEFETGKIRSDDSQLPREGQKIRNVSEGSQGVVEEGRKEWLAIESYEKQAPKKAIEKLPTPAEAWESLRAPEQPAFESLSKDIQKLWKDEYKASEGIVDKSAVDGLVKAEQALPAKGEAGVDNPHTKESVQAELKKLYGENAPQIEVSDRATEKTDAATKGFFEPSTGRAVLVADNIGRGENLHGLMRHEVAVHAKKLGKSDKEFQGILKQVDSLKAQGAKDIAEAFDRVHKDTKAEDITHEALAYLVQHKPDLPVVKRFMSWLRRTANKLTGNAEWLKGDDFTVMADAVLKKAAKETKTEIKAGKAEERQYSKAPLVKETEAESSLKRGMNAAVKAFEGNLWTKLETNYVNRHAALANAIKDKATIDSNGKYRADLIGSANDQIFNVISAGITDGVPVFSRAGTVMIQKDAKKNLSNIAKRIDKLNVKNPRVFVGEIARALRGESLKKEDAEAIKQIDILEDKAKKLKAYAKTQAFAEGKKADTLANRYLAEAKKLKDRVGEEGREKLVTDEDILEAKRRLAEHPEIQKILDDVHGLMNSLVDLWEASGLVSKDVANEWRSKPSYIPLYMSQEDILNDPSRVVRAMGGGAKSLPNVKTLKGGTHAINLLENLQKHYAFMTSAAAQNSYRKAAARDLELFGAAQRTSPDDKNAIMFKENGKEIYYKISDPLMFEAFQAAAPLTNPLLKAAREYTKAFRAVTLVNPLYWYRQLIRDPIHANVVSQTGMVTPIGATISFAKIIAGASPEYAELRRRGVVGAVDSLSDPARFKKIYDKGPHLFKKGADWVMHVHEAADAATRVEVYKAAVKEAKKKGMSREQAKDYATMRAREIINFANQGRSETLQAIRATVPFFSAALNSLDSVARAAAGKGLNRREAAEARRLFTSRMLMIASFTTAYALAMQDDEEYLKSPDSINNWLWPTGDKENPFIMIPLPFELGFVAKIFPEWLVRLNSGTLTPYEGKKMLKEAAGATLTPPLPFPQVIKPLVEAAINYDLHQGRPIVSPSEAGKLPEEQTKGASALSIEVGRKLGLSPAQIEHFGRGYMTELWTVVGVLSDAFLPAGQYKEAKNIAEVPTLLGGAKGILSKPDRDRDMDIFYELSNGAQQIKRSVTAAQGKGDVEAMERIMADPEKKKRFYASDVGREIGDELSEVNTAIEQIRNDKSITAPKKQEMIREKQQYKNKLATQGKEWFYSLGVNEP